jgi:hypothetical protein
MTRGSSVCGKTRLARRFDAASAPSPTGASGKPATPAPNNLFDIELKGRSGIEASLEFRPQPGDLFAATLLMRDCRDDYGFATAFAHLRGHKFFENCRQFYGVGWHCCPSIGDACVWSNRKIDTVAKT